MLSVQSFIFSPIEENTYVVYNEKNECAIIDPGCYYDEEKEKLAKFITDKQLSPVLLLNTHCHLDHVFGNKFVAEKFKLTLHIHPSEKKLLDFAPASGLMYNLPFDNYTGEIKYIDSVHPIMIGKDELKVFETPGHSPGSVCFYSSKDNFIVSGDILFSGSIGRTDLPGGDYDSLIKNIRDKLFTLPGNTVVYSGHGEPTTIETEKNTNPFFISQ